MMIIYFASDSMGGPPTALALSFQAGQGLAGPGRSPGWSISAMCSPSVQQASLGAPGQQKRDPRDQVAASKVSRGQGSEIPTPSLSSFQLHSVS